MDSNSGQPVTNTRISRNVPAEPRPDNKICDLKVSDKLLPRPDPGSHMIGRAASKHCTMP